MKGVDKGKVPRTAADTEKVLHEFALLTLSLLLLLYSSQDTKGAEGLSQSHWPVPKGDRPPEAKLWGGLLWPHACVRAGQLVVMGLAGQNKLSEHQHIHRIAGSG